MKTIRVYDKPMCCPTGVCGTDVDPVLPRFAADLQWLKSQGHQVERFNLAQQPGAFMEDAQVHRLLATQGTNCLPLIMIDGRIVSQSTYPTRDSLVLLAAGGLNQIVQQEAGGPCCGGNSSC